VIKDDWSRVSMLHRTTQTLQMCTEVSANHKQASLN